jgi:DNA-binding NarL/FixJ family response regulator
VIRVLLVDDQPLARAGLRRILRPRAGFEVVGECDDGDQVERAVAATTPDVVVMDVRMKRMDGAEATRRLRSREGSPPVLVLTTFDEDEVLSASLRAGASGFQLKDAPGAELLKAVKTVAEGGAYLDLAVTHRVLAAFGAQATPALRPPDSSLTPREREVLVLVGRGLANGEIARELYISEVTVKAHLGHVLTKLDLRDRAAAIVYAFDTGLVSPGGPGGQSTSGGRPPAG